MTVVNRSSYVDPKKLLQREFTNVGLRPKDVFSMLPEWWGEAVMHPSGVFEVRGFVAKHFGLEIGPNGRLRQCLMPHACFKTRTGTNVSEIASARAMATAVAKVVASITTNRWSGALPLAARLRATAVINGNMPWVGLDDLLNACWSNGVPVIYMPSLPVAKPKMDGIVTSCGSRPVILVTKKAPAPAWILFVLAHEMGHIALGHLDQCDEGGAIVDEQVSEESDDTDEQERAANTYALQVLTGGKDIRLTYLTNAAMLADAAFVYGRTNGIDPGHVILNAVKNSPINGKAPWPLGNAALKCIGENLPTVEEICREALRRNVDIDALPDDSFEFLERIGLL